MGFERAGVRGSATKLHQLQLEDFYPQTWQLSFKSLFIIFLIGVYRRHPTTILTLNRTSMLQILSFPSPSYGHEKIKATGKGPGFVVSSEENGQYSYNIEIYKLTRKGKREYDFCLNYESFINELVKST